MAAVGNSCLAAQTTDSDLHLVDLSDGQVLWSLKLKSEARQIKNFGEFIFAQLDNSWVAINLKAGKAIKSIKPFKGSLVGECSGCVVIRDDDGSGLALLGLKNQKSTRVSTAKIVAEIGKDGVLKTDIKGNWFLEPTVEDDSGDSKIGTQRRDGFLLGSSEDGLVFQNGASLTSYKWSGEKLARVKLSEPYKAGVNLVSFEALEGTAIGKPYDPTTTKPGVIGFDLLTGKVKWNLDAGEFLSCGLSSSEDFCWLFQQVKSSVELVCVNRQDGKRANSQKCDWVGVIPTTSGLIGYSTTHVGTVDI